MEQIKDKGPGLSTLNSISLTKAGNSTHQIRQHSTKSPATTRV